MEAVCYAATEHHWMCVDEDRKDTLRFVFTGYSDMKTNVFNAFLCSMWQTFNINHEFAKADGASYE